MEDGAETTPVASSRFKMPLVLDDVNDWNKVYTIDVISVFVRFFHAFESNVQVFKT